MLIILPYQNKFNKMKRRNFISQTAFIPLVTAQSIFKFEANESQKPFVIKKGKARHDKHLPFGKNPNDLKVSKKDSQGGFALLEYIGKEKIGPALHVHLAQDELFFVVEGEYKFLVGEEYHELTSGDCIFLPRGIPHTWIQRSTHGRLIYLVSPAGSFEDFFEEIISLKSPPTKELIDDIHKRHQMVVLGPPLSL